MKRSLHHHIAAKIRLTPAPSSASELHYIYNSFSRLGIIESFKVNRPELAFSNEIRLLLNLGGSSKLDPLQLYHKPNQQEISDKMALMTKYLSTIVALPRYQYIKNNEAYLDGKIGIDFKYNIVNGTPDFIVSPSTIQQPFCLIEENDLSVIKRVKKDMRYNFEVFTKLDIMLLKMTDNPITTSKPPPSLFPKHH